MASVHRVEIFRRTRTGRLMLRAASPFKFGSVEPASTSTARSKFRHRLIASDPIKWETLSDAVGGEEFDCDQTFSFLAEPRRVSNLVSLVDCGLGILALLFVLSIPSARIFFSSPSVPV
jgi:hypothetical protein